MLVFVQLVIFSRTRTGSFSFFRGASNMFLTQNIEQPEMPKLFWGSLMWSSPGQVGLLHPGSKKWFFKTSFTAIHLNTPGMWWLCKFQPGKTKEGPTYLPDPWALTFYLINNLDKGQYGKNYTGPNWRGMKIHTWQFISLQVIPFLLFLILKNPNEGESWVYTQAIIEILQPFEYVCNYFN